MFNKVPHINRRKFIQGLLVLDVAFFTFTDPTRVNSIFLIFGFVLIAITAYTLINRLCNVGGDYGMRLSRRSQQIALFGTGIIITLMALQSIGELTLRDLFVSAPLGTLAYVYLSYGRSKKHISGSNAV